MLGDLGMGSTPEVDILIKAIDQTQGAFGSVSGGLSLITAAAAAATAIIVGTGAAIVQVTKTTLAWGVSLHDTMVVLGATSAQAAGLTLAADASGVSIETVTTRMMMFEKGLQSTNGKMGVSAKQLADLGINYKNANGTMMTSTELLQSVADWFVKTTDVTARNNAEMTIFGRGGAAMDDMLINLANGGMQSYIDQAQKLGLALDNNQIDKIHQVSEQMAILQDAFKGAEVTLGVTFIPVLQNLVTWFEKMLAAEMPAITQFGQFLTMLTGAPAGALGAATGGGGGGGTPASGSPGGKTLAPWATAADKAYALAHPDQYYVPGTAGSGGGTGHDFGASPDQLQLTPFENSIKTFVVAITSVNWGQVASDFKTAGGYVAQIIKNANMVGGSLGFGSNDAKNPHLVPAQADSWSVVIQGLLKNNTAGNQQVATELAREWHFDILDPAETAIKGFVIKTGTDIATWFTTPIIIIDPVAAAVWFDNSLVIPIINAVEISAKTLAGDMDKATAGVNTAFYNFGNDILRSVDNFLAMLGLGPIGGKWPGADKKAGGGSFSGWAMVGDAPGGGTTPFTEYVYAPHGATVYNQSQMSGHGAPPMAGGGNIGGVFSDQDRRWLQTAFRDAILKAK
jgi:hypothetical protein